VARLTETPNPTLDSLESRASEIRSIVESVQWPDSTTIGSPVSPMLDRSLNVSNEVAKGQQSSSAPSANRQSPSLHELDRQFSQLEAEEEKEKDTRLQEEVVSRATPKRSAQTNGDISMERIADEHGGEMIEGTIKVFFEIGQKRAHLHVPFSPPLGGQPEVECEPAHDDGVRVKVAVRQPYGIRIEARRTEAEDALRSEVSFAAVYTKKL
jgi:hypothetical protein